MGPTNDAEQKLLETEQELIREARLPERGADAKRLGARRGRNRDRDRGGENGKDKGGGS